MLVEFEHRTKDYDCWPELSGFMKRFEMNAYDHHGLMVAEIEGLIVLAGDAYKRQAEFQKWPSVADQLFELDQDLKKAAAPFLVLKGTPRVNTVFVDLLKIDDECRGRGYGTELLRKLSVYQDIAPLVILRASPLLSELEDIPKSKHKAAKTRLQAFYKSLGFTCAGEDTYSIRTKDLANIHSPARRLNPPQPDPRKPSSSPGLSMG
ncbi:MAG: GNAT family N-acetyltransferase [Hafnia sp.]